MVIIRDIAKRTGNGVAAYAKNADNNTNGDKTIKDHGLCYHYVVGLVGEGLTRLFVKSELVNPALLKQTSIIRNIQDIREDNEDKRYTRAKQAWSTKLSDLFRPQNREKALQCGSEMARIALNRADDFLFQKVRGKKQSVFKIVAIPQSIAIATLEFCFQNLVIFDRNVKITKGLVY